MEVQDENNEQFTFRYFACFGSRLMVLVIANPSIVFGAERELAVEFAYTPAEPSQAAVAYNIYAGDTLVCTPQVGVDPNVLFCDAAELASGPYDWTMEAIFEDGMKSPMSPAYAFTLPLRDAVSPQIITIRMNYPGSN